MYKEEGKERTPGEGEVIKGMRMRMERKRDGRTGCNGCLYT
jgi:hypothetical protein